MYVFASLVLILVTILVLYVRRRFSYFKKHGIQYAPGVFPLGSWHVWRVFGGQESLLQVADRYYDQFSKYKAFGFYKPFGEPVLVIKDMELTRRIMVKDFDHFVDRNFFKPNPKGNLHASMMLAVLKGDAWKASRNLLSPMFTSSKLKAIMPLMHQGGRDLTKYLNQFNEFDSKEVFQRYTIEILGTLGCGAKPNVLENGTNEFFKQAMELSGTSTGLKQVKAILRFATTFFFPEFAYHTNMPVFEQDNLNFFINVINKSIEMRKNNNVRRNDFIDLLQDSVQEMEQEQKQKIFSDKDFQDYVVANGLMLFFVGNDTSSGCLALAMHYLARLPEVQEKLYQEIQDAVDENGGNMELDYNQLNNMSYMGKFIRETIRLWGVNFFDRTCTKDYYVPELNYTIPKGMHVTMAGGAMHQDAANFEDPLEFDPEKHFDSNSPFPPNFIGFGQGPRNCIGMRFAYTIVRTGLLHTLYKYKITKGPNSKDDWFFSPIVPGGISHGDIIVNLEPRF